RNHFAKSSTNEVNNPHEHPSQHDERWYAHQDDGAHLLPDRRCDERLGEPVAQFSKPLHHFEILAHPLGGKPLNWCVMSTVSTVLVKAPAGIYQGLSHDGVNFFHSIDSLDLPTRFAPAQPAELAPEQLVGASVERPPAVALSISTPDDARPGSDHPLVVDIHGGRFESGTDDLPRAEGTAKARHGVVQVQVGYRVGFE